LPYVVICDCIVKDRGRQCNADVTVIWVRYVEGSLF